LINQAGSLTLKTYFASQTEYFEGQISEFDITPNSFTGCSVKKPDLENIFFASQTEHFVGQISEFLT
jgi:hypothetical protein